MGGVLVKRSVRGRAGVVLAALVLVCATAGCWTEEGFDAAHSGFNPNESVLTAANVHGLTRAWTANTGTTTTVFTPIVVANRVFVGANDAIEAFDTGTG